MANFDRVHADLVKFFNLLKAKMPIVLTFGYRSIEQQDRLYAQGRTKPGKIVTNARGGQSPHNYGLAIDLAPLKNGKIDWNDLKLFEEMVRLGKEVAREHNLPLTFGADFKSLKDLPHVELTNWKNMK
jgi:peptidoglycan L-alanyl-D-glutamate endopeptidase CwlK